MSTSDEFFELYNPIQPGQKKSFLENLIDTAAFAEEWATEVADRLEAYSAIHIAVCLQLPRPLFLQDAIYKAPALRNGMKIEFQFHPIFLQASANGNLVADSGKKLQKYANATQVFAYVPLWGRWSEGFQRYQRCFSAHGFKNDIVLGEKRYFGGRALRARDFEHELAARLTQEVMHALRRLLKSYSTLARDQHTEDIGPYGAFMMPYPGRVCSFGTPVPLAHHFLNKTASGLRQPIEAKRIIDGLEFTYRKFSRFENQIFQLNELINSKNYALALAGSLSLIEWILRLSAPKQLKAQSLSKLIQYFGAGALGNDRILLDELRGLRNTAIHLGEHSDFGRLKPYQILEIDIDKEIDKQTALRAVDLSWRIFKKANAGELH